MEPSAKRKTALVAAGMSTVVSAALVVRIVAIERPAVTVILIPAIIGAVVAAWRPESRVVSAIAASLTALTVLVSLIGGVGLLYVPSIALWLWCVTPARAPRGT